jgi:hypothetical protein
MKTYLSPPALLLAAAVCAAATMASDTPGGSSRVRVLRTPEGGLQPQTVADGAGTIHMIYLKGDPKSADIYYSKRGPGETAFSRPLRVNSDPGTATAIGTIRGAQLAVGKGDRVHVTWNGVNKSRDVMGSPMLYSRLNDTKSGFEPQRNLMTGTVALDGGGSVAADARGNVYVAWHAARAGMVAGEEGRAVYVATSTDEGKTFSTEKATGAGPKGVCACCGMKVFADAQGNLVGLYRAASQKINRDVVLLTSNDRGQSFKASPLHPWEVTTCPMSSQTITTGRSGLLLGWESAGQVFFTTLDPKSFQPGSPISAPGQGKRKHPALAANAEGETLLAWTEGTGWNKGGSLAWQLYGPDGKPRGAIGRADGVPAWSLATAFAEPDGTFTIVY